MQAVMGIENEAQETATRANWVRAQLEGSGHTRDELKDVLGMAGHEVDEALELLNSWEVPVREVKGMFYIQIGESG